MVTLVKQLEVQKRGNGCGKYPQSCLIRELLNEAGLLKPLTPLKILDLTYGEGRFWALLPNAKVWGFDVRRLRWVRKPYVFFNESCVNWRKRVGYLGFDLVVADPPFGPYRRGWERRTHYYDDGSAAVILTEARKASIYFSAPLLIHYLGKIVFWGFDIVAEKWWLGHGRYSALSYPTWYGILVPNQNKIATLKEVF